MLYKTIYFATKSFHLTANVNPICAIQLTDVISLDRNGLKILNETSNLHIYQVLLLARVVEEVSCGTTAQSSRKTSWAE